jgi:uncharacterized membrane protein YhhN
MNKNIWILHLAIALIGDLIGIQLGDKTIQFIFKPLIIPAIIGFFSSQVHKIAEGFNKWIVAALIFSLLGDVLLMFQDNNSLFFILGLSAFLLAHIFYIVYFHQVRVKENIKSNVWLVVIVVVYYAVLIAFLFPYLGDMTLPVCIYGIVISFMFMLAMHMLFIKNKPGGGWMMAGALLFVISDSILAINKFYQPFRIADILIMLTYGFAQFYIVTGAAEYYNAERKK